jgi:sortase family protein
MADYGRDVKLNRAGASLVAGLLGLSGAGIAWIGLHEPQSPPGPPADVHSAASTGSGQPHAITSSSKAGGAPARPTGGGVPDPLTGTVLPASPPLTVTLPRLGIHSDLVHLGVLANGAMEVPANPARAGWYTLGPTPGELGPAVIAGHVTWNGPAVFFRLGSIRRGDKIEVTRRDGLTAIFEVTGVRRFPKVRFPTRVVFGTIDYAGLRLITCGGTYDSSAHRYLDNLVVFARLVAAHSTSR